jgi:multicomponent Na+:H+ antiporter subunit D
MTLAASLLPVSVLLPLGVASALLAIAHWLPSRLSTGIAIVTSLACAALCAWLARQALDGPILHWFGGWTPGISQKPGVVLGISFAADPASAAVAAFCGLLFANAFIFSWGYFDEVHSHFEILMLLFLAAMIGFCLTRDLFNLFVWFELMSVAAFALTAYPLGQSSLEGALNFTVTNGLASFMMLAGVGLLYARTGTLDFTRMGEVVAQRSSDPVLTGGFCLIAAALLTKAAIVPFHMWLSDAHAVAPSPVSVIFSGVMVSLGLFAVAKLVTYVFAADPAIRQLVSGLLLWLGIATALIGGAMTWSQRHLKRMLAFSTISHMGIMLAGLASLSASGMSGFLLYLAGHGLTKGALFMVAGILLALRASADEIVLYNQGKALWPAGVAMGIGGLLLAGMPVGRLHEATHLILDRQDGLTSSAILFATALTGAAVLRATARIFVGWSGVPGPELSAPTAREHEKADRPLWLMLLPCAVLLILVFIPQDLVDPFLGPAGARFLHPGSRDVAALTPETNTLASFAPLIIALTIVGVSLCRRRATRSLSRALRSIEETPVRILRFLHSGLVGDYVVWMMTGLAAFAIAVSFKR